MNGDQDYRELIRVEQTPGTAGPAPVMLAEPVFEQRWQFDDRVTDQFDQMLERSIPQYEVMRAACFEVGRRFVEPATEIVDLGASRGAAVQPFIDECGARNSYTLCEVSEPMAVALEQRFEGWLNCHKRQGGPRLMQLSRADLRAVYPNLISGLASLTLAVLVIQFTPIEYRKRIMQRVFDKTIKGGAVIMVEKVLGKTDRMDALYTDVYLKRKRDVGGYSLGEIERKRLALEGVLVPITAEWNEQLLRDAGFSEVECFWRWMNFAAWVAVK